MCKVAIINGPNLNYLGIREPRIYGKISFEDVFKDLEAMYPSIRLSYYQSNEEGKLITYLQKVGFDYNGIIFNPAAYAHSSIALRDTITMITTPVIEVHISHIGARETFRQISITAPACIGIISGFGVKSYTLALHYFMLNQKGHSYNLQG